jgi:hypothetical protein
LTARNKVHSRTYRIKVALTVNFGVTSYTIGNRAGPVWRQLCRIAPCLHILSPTKRQAMKPGAYNTRKRGLKRCHRFHLFPEFIKFLFVTSISWLKAHGNFEVLMS